MQNEPQFIYICYCTSLKRDQNSESTCADTHTVIYMRKLISCKKYLLKMRRSLVEWNNQQGAASCHDL